VPNRLPTAVASSTTTLAFSVLRCRLLWIFPLSEANARMAAARDFIGYGANPPDPQWPGGARVVVNINLNFEGGGERSMMEGMASPKAC
jgi:hypothetical protein